MTAAESRAQGERVRLMHALDRVEAMTKSIRSVASTRAIPDPGDAQAIAAAGVEIACIISRWWAFGLAAGDATAPANKKPRSGAELLAAVVRACPEGIDVDAYYARLGKRPPHEEPK